jgi:NAD+ kinase
MMPQVDALVITPICPHSFTNRPLVVQDNAKIVVEVQSGSDKGVLSIDGQIGVPVEHGDRIECHRAAHNVKLLRTTMTFFDILRTKLKWG